MEVLTSSIISKPHLSSSISPFTSSLTTLSKKTPYKFRKTLLKSFPNSSFSSTLPLKTSKNSHITARFGRPTKRRNSLRKKLTGGDDLKVRENPQKIVEPVHHFVDNQIIDSNLGSDILEKDSGVVGSSQIDFENSTTENSRQFGDSVLWDKLEGWVEQYKKDVEYWGIGSNPIFTVFQDSKGDVEQVLVDEDEILRRNGVEPLFFREESELKAFDEVNLKIAHAKFLAKESKSGKNVFPKNSSVAKFVVSGESSGFVSRIKSMFVPQMSPAKVSRVAIAVAFGFVVISVIKRLFTLGRKEVEMTSFEREMLRRKKRSRMTKEKLHKGSVEVVEEPFDPPTVVTERPLLDKEEVLNSIREAKGLNNSLLMLDVGGAQETESAVMDTKIREIQMMARQARDIERREGSPSEGDELDEKIPEEMQLEKKETVEGSEDSIWIDELEKEASIALPSKEEDAAESHVVGDKNLMNKPASEKYAETTIFNGSPEIETSDNLKTHSKDAIITTEKVSERSEDVKLHSISGVRIMDDKKIHDVSDSLDSTGIHSYVSRSQVNPPMKTSARRKPKIIRSVKEAREYLMQRQNKKPEDVDIPTTAAAKDEGMNNNYSQRLGEDDKVSDSSDANRKVDCVPAPTISRDYTVKRNEFLATDTNGLKVELESGLKLNRPSDPPIAENSGIDTTLNFGKTMKIDEMLKPSDSHERSIPMASETKFCDTGQEAAEQPLLSEQSLEKADKFDEIPKHTDLGKISEHVSGRNSSHYTSNSTAESGMTHDNALHDASLQKKEHLPNDNGNVKLDETIEPPTTKLGETYVPAAVGRDVNGLASEENASLMFETKDEDSYESKPLSVETFQGSGKGVEEGEGVLIADKEKWLEKNFQEVEPIVKKIGSGFRNNYNVAREKTKQEDAEFDLMRLSSIKDGTELEWMQDDKLREIVFKVRENELAGRDPFHSMDPEDKVAFFEGLENKVEIENQKLSVLHEWLHSNIENVDYGADGISLYDPPEKVIPQWKGPPLDKIPDFLNNSRDQQQVNSSLQKVNKSTNPDNAAETSLEGSRPKSAPREKASKFSKTVIEASDGSIKPGKRSGKEFWQHTKKWSRGFVESYNAETDPEVKSVMKDIGKDLDRWITEKEIQESADLMDKIPQKGKEVIEKKLNKLKREMELFGPQAVVSKYREYAEVKEEDYLWWLDLPHLLCIELYTYEGEDQRVGFYSLEMAGDLEIEPKPTHVIAFEDPGDCKNFCYIIQAHLEMLGNGKAFIIPLPPKDVFWQAKANGFGVTVIRKGELKLNVDQALEEVEELITEIGSKMYHDKIMRERSVDISSLMKGVLGVSPPSKRKRKKRARKRPSK